MGKIWNEAFRVVLRFRHRLRPHRQELGQVKSGARLKKVFAEESANPIPVDPELAGLVLPGQKVHFEYLLNDEVRLELLQGRNSLGFVDFVEGPLNRKVAFFHFRRSQKLSCDAKSNLANKYQLKNLSGHWKRSAVIQAVGRCCFGE